MDSKKWHRLKKLFKEALECDPKQRAAWLHEACGGDTDLRKEVEDLIAADSQAKEFMEEPPTPEREEFDLKGKKIGQYKIEALVSSGGMGTVYRAVQESPQRTVAFKVLRKGFASKTVLRRFEFESQILATLKHPNIAQVIESGTHFEDESDRSNGFPYFVMEYIAKARPITEYAWKEKLSITQRLRLFLQISNAVHYGHQRGVIHRDLKPSNILVNQEGQVKIIDFGVARTVDSDIALTTVQTDVGQLIGTIQYMSPEQCKADPNDLDIRSDVYALGVVLYELLCEQLPYDVRKAVIFEATRIIKEETPRRPSTTNRALRGDVETIVLKALEKDRTRRYQSMADFGSDISRYLKGEVILAKPAGPMTRSWKCVKRNPLASTIISMALLTVVTLVLFFVFVSYPQIKEERDIAEAERKKAVSAKKEAEDQRKAALLAKAQSDKEMENTNTINRFIQDIFFSADPYSLGRDITLIEMLDRAVKKIDAEFPDRPDIEAPLRLRIGKTYTGHGLFEAAENQFKQAYELAVKLGGEEHHTTVIAMNWRGANYLEMDKRKEAKAILSKAVEISGRILTARDETYTRARIFYANVLHQEGQYEEAGKIQKKAMESLIRYRGKEDIYTLSAMHFYADTLVNLGELNQAESILNEVLEIRNRVLGEKHPGTLNTMNSLAILMDQRGNYEQAEVIYQKTLDIYNRVLGANHPDTLITLNNMANMMKHRGDPKRAETLLRDLLKRRIERYSEENSKTLVTMVNLAGNLETQGRYDEAEKYFRKAIEIKTRTLGADHLSTLATQKELGSLLNFMGRYEESRELLEKTIQSYKNANEAKHPGALSALNLLGAANSKLKNYEKAAELYNEVLDAYRDTKTEEHSHTLNVMNNLAMVLEKQNKNEEAEDMYRKVLKIRKKLNSKGDLNTLKTMINFGFLLMKMNNLPGAEDMFRDGLEMAQRALSPDHYMAMAFHLAYGGAVWRLARYEEAETHLLKGYNGYFNLLGPGHYRVLYALKEVIGLYEAWDKPEEAAKWKKLLPPEPEK